MFRLFILDRIHKIYGLNKLAGQTNWQVKEGLRLRHINVIYSIYLSWQKKQKQKNVIYYFLTKKLVKIIVQIKFVENLTFDHYKGKNFFYIYTILGEKWVMH